MIPPFDKRELATHDKQQQIEELISHLIEQIKDDTIVSDRNKHDIFFKVDEKKVKECVEKIMLLYC